MKDQETGLQKKEVELEDIDIEGLFPTLDEGSSRWHIEHNPYDMTRHG